ncbi:MAG TPA: EamA family transporter [Acidimicrobiales bacterium]|nr:EamA family transporter [Acidimicrobiales bacterium]
MTGTRLLSRPLPGAALAGITTMVSGVSVWVNSYGVRAIHSASVYTTAKNLVAAAVLLCLAGATRLIPGRRPRPSPPTREGRRQGVVRHSLGLTYVGVVGGGVAFVLFFNGLAATAAASAAFWRDTLVLWVAAMAVPILRERIRWWNLAAIGLLVAGQIVMSGGVGHLATDRGQLLVLASSVLWGIEVIVVKTLLRDLPPSGVGAARMSLGAVALIVYLAATGRFGQLAALDLHQLDWALLTGGLLALYVATWMAALSRARAVDVTSVLVGSAVITWLLQTASGTAAPAPRSLGLLLIAVGAAAVLWSAARRPASGRRSVTS